jgi:two-component system cell cycle response regulator
MNHSLQAPNSIRALRVLGLAGLAAFALHAAASDGGEGLLGGWVYNGVIATAAALCLARAWLVRAERRAWLVLGAGLLAWTAGEVHYTVELAELENPPYPSIGDAFFLAFYPASYVGLVMLVRARVPRFSASLWLDGLVAALAIAAIGAVALGPIVHSTGSNLAAVATDLAYPLFDLVLVAVVGAVFALTGWRPGRSWMLIGAGLATAAIADGAFLYLSASGTYVEGTLIDALWPAATLLIGLAAWSRGPAAAAMRLEGWRLLVIPSAFACAGLALLVYDHFEPLNDISAALAGGTLLAVIVRMAMAFRENLRMLATSQAEALTDALTGLGNRRRLMSDLYEALTPPADAHALLIFDLDGFKRYNDSFGHPAGDALLARLGHRLGAAADRAGATAYRLGGDEFCVLAPIDGGDEPVIEATTAALTESGTGFEVQSSYGVVLLPHEATDPSGALQLADRRLYARKGESGRSAARLETRDVLLQALAEREPELRGHVDDVAAFALAVGRLMELPAEELDAVTRAAELHDVGKMAVPEPILRKPGSLDDAEWALMHQHTLIGERILTAAPALAPVARLVRSSHERYDGTGYPDGLEGEEIPLGARIVSVCDAYHAMTSDRPYRRAMTSEAALAELERCSGRQFDAQVVAAFRSVLGDAERAGAGERRAASRAA